MKILIMSIAKIKYTPYINFHLDNIDKIKNEVHILYWNRDLQEENTKAYDACTLHEFRCYQEDDVSKVTKVGSFMKYRKFAKNLILQGKFDFILILDSLTGVLLADIFKKHYVGKYIFDYRDSSYEKFPPFKKVIGNLVRNSSATFVSSDAFRRFLPAECEDKILTSHNMLMDSLLHRDEKKIHGIASDKIRIAFWGIIRHEQINRELIRKISADDRFELHYYGREQQVALNLKQYASEIKAQNVFFHGEYSPEDRYEFVRNTDLIHNIYNDANMMLAVGNKYYDASIFYIPLISMRGSFMAEIAKKASIGFDVDPYDDDFTEKLFEAYRSIDKNVFMQNCDKELERVLLEYNSCSALIKKLTDAEGKD